MSLEQLGPIGAIALSHHRLHQVWLEDSIFFIARRKGLVLSKSHCRWAAQRGTGWCERETHATGMHAEQLVSLSSGDLFHGQIWPAIEGEVFGLACARGGGILSGKVRPAPSAIALAKAAFRACGAP